MRNVSVLPPDFLARWQAFAEWGIASAHGPACKFALMFCLTLKTARTADREHIEYVRPRIYKVKTPKGVQTQRVSLFNDSLTAGLLDTIDNTRGLKKQVFPRCPCGSAGAEEWAHHMASRKTRRNAKNFRALSECFGVDLPTWSPLEIYVVSIAVFRSSFSWPHSAEESFQVLSSKSV